MSVQGIMVCREPIAGCKNETVGRTCSHAVAGLRRGSTTGRSWVVKGTFRKVMRSWGYGFLG